MSVGIYFLGLYVKIYKIKSGLAQRGGDICFPLKTPSSLSMLLVQNSLHCVNIMTFESILGVFLFKTGMLKKKIKIE